MQTLGLGSFPQSFVVVGRKVRNYESPGPGLGGIVAEFLNTLGGKFLNEFLEPGQMYSLGTPEPGEVASALCEEFVRTWCFMAEGMEFTVTLTGEEFGDSAGR